MSDVKQAIAELNDVVRCRCNPAYTGRGLHDPECQCDSADAVKTVSDEIAALQARVAELEALVKDDEEKAKWVGRLTDDWIAAEARADAAEALLSEAVKAVEQEMLRVCNEYSKKGNMAAATAIHDTWLCVQTALAAIQEAKQ